MLAGLLDDLCDQNCYLCIPLLQKKKIWKILTTNIGKTWTQVFSIVTVYSNYFCLKQMPHKMWKGIKSRAIFTNGNEFIKALALWWKRHAFLLLYTEKIPEKVEKVQIGILNIEIQLFCWSLGWWQRTPSCSNGRNLIAT